MTTILSYGREVLNLMHPGEDAASHIAHMHVYQLCSGTHPLSQVT